MSKWMRAREGGGERGECVCMCCGGEHELMEGREEGVYEEGED